MADDPLATAHKMLDEMRAEGAGLDGTDESLWFIQGVVSAMARDPSGSDRFQERFAYAVYVAELLASTCDGVRVEVDADVRAVREGGATQLVRAWVEQCFRDPNADNIVFKYAGALRDYGEDGRAARLDQQLREMAESGHSF